jgi:hypothetical protein
MDTEDATAVIDSALTAQGIATHWVVNTPGTLRVTFSDGTVATVTIEIDE